jgi:hypothetical protein
MVTFRHSATAILRSHLSVPDSLERLPRPRLRMLAKLEG